ncbi:cytochrome b562 [Enterobacteriaceae bacterium LUAb1]
MCKHVISLLTVALMSLSTLSVAASLESDMKDMSAIYQSLVKAKSAGEMYYMLKNLRTKAEDARNGIPDILAGRDLNDPQIKAYQQGIDELVTQIDKTNAFVQQGKLHEAKIEAQKIASFRDRNHQKFR